MRAVPEAVPPASLRSRHAASRPPEQGAAEAEREATAGIGGAASFHEARGWRRTDRCGPEKREVAGVEAASAPVRPAPATETLPGHMALTPEREGLSDQQRLVLEPAFCEDLPRTQVPGRPAFLPAHDDTTASVRRPGLGVLRRTGRPAMVLAASGSALTRWLTRSDASVEQTVADGGKARLPARLLGRLRAPEKRHRIAVAALEGGGRHAARNADVDRSSAHRRRGLAPPSSCTGTAMRSNR